MKKLLFYGIILTIIFIPLCSATHNIVGFVEDARDTTEANGHSILLWNPSVGINDNLSDTIGLLGNSGISNAYRIDCELLSTPCIIGDILTVKVIDNGDTYVSEEKNVTVSSGSEDSSENITLNSPPTANIIFPSNLAYISNLQVNFNCSSSDLDNNIKEISLYGNWTGDWSLNETKEINPNGEFTIFTKDFSQGFYKYACKVTDNLYVSSFSSQNNSFTLDITKPSIDSIYTNTSSSCGKENSIRVNCTTHDDLSGVNKVIIQAISPIEIINYSAPILTGDTYYSDILLNETGAWKFNCIVNDSAGNIKNLASEYVQVNFNLPELYVNFSKINLSINNPIENQSIQINAIIENLGCTDAENVLISFFEGDPLDSGQNIGNSTVNISAISSVITNIPWNTKIGPNNIFVYADYTLLINEENESNNKANKTISVNAWQEIYGNTSVDKIIGNETSNIKKWFNESSLQGNVFITDSESYVNWLSLQAIGKTKTGAASSNDFSDIDELLEMTTFEDSVSNMFSNNQNPKKTQNILVHQKAIMDVPTINSTDNSNFVTGILWDTSDDVVDGEYSAVDKEDLVFIAPVGKQSEGAYGFYNYEIKIPSKLREYNTLDSQEIYLYYDLN
jgi:hypothetical protein